MLPCHAYPGLKKYKHLVGNYGGAWQDQRKEFDAFPGAILMTTNCIQKPKESYLDRIFTSGLVAWPGVRHIGPERDFSPVIEAALAAARLHRGCAGTDDHRRLRPQRRAGRGRQGRSRPSRAGQIRHFFLVGGCDGAKPGRNYFTEFAQKVPDDCVMLTLACGKYRFNKLDFGAIDGIPRLLDVGQCNDAYSAVKIATALAEAFNCGVNDLPLSLVLSWYEQKAVAILLTLLVSGHQEHPPRPEPAGVHHAAGPLGSGRQVPHRPDHNGGGRPGGDPGMKYPAHSVCRAWRTERVDRDEHEPASGSASGE